MFCRQANNIFPFLDVSVVCGICSGVHSYHLTIANSLNVTKKSLFGKLLSAEQSVNGTVAEIDRHQNCFLYRRSEERRVGKEC